MTDQIIQLQPAAQEPAAGPKLWGGWATIGLGFAIGLLFIAAQTLAVLCFLLVKLSTGTISNLQDYIQSLSTNGLVVSISTLASAVVGIAFIYLFVRLRGNKNLGEYLGLKRISWKTVLVVVAVFLLTLGATLLLENLATNLAGSSAESGNTSFMTDTYKTAGWLPLLWVSVVIFAPAFEEAFFRGFLFVGLERSRIGIIGTVVLTSLVWALLHLQYNVWGMAEILLMGFVLGTLRYKTRSLWSTFLFHSAWNLVALIGTALAVKGT
jgi:CAAX protease family protein